MRTPARTASAAGLRLLAHHDLGGHGDGMQALREGCAVYVGHTSTTGAGTSMLDVSKPEAPALAAQWPAPPHSHTHKVQVAGGLLLVNHERFPYRAAAAEPFSAGLAIYRLDDPFHPEQAGFWRSGGRGVHRVMWTLIGGDRAYLGYDDAGRASTRTPPRWSPDKVRAASRSHHGSWHHPEPGSGARQRERLRGRLVAVAHAWLGEQVAGPGGVGFEFAA